MNIKPTDYLTVGDIEALPEGSVVLDRDNDAWQVFDGLWYAYGESPFTAEELFEWQPIALVWEGENG